MVAVPLIFGTLTAAHYEDQTARDPRIDALREKIRVTENPRYSRDYLDPDKRSIANRVQVFFTDGSATEPIESRIPDRPSPKASRRDPTPAQQVRRELEGSVCVRIKLRKLIATFNDAARLDQMRTDQLMDLLVG